VALIHRATLGPGKAELLADWLTAQPWGPGDAADLERVGAYRFEDPDGRVGLETHLVRVAGEVWQVALTYRDAPLPDAEAAEVGRMHHSVLGERWVYDGCADPAYVRMLAATALTGVGQSVEVGEEDGRSQVLPPTVRLSGAGSIAELVDIGGFGSPVRNENGVALLRSSALDLRFHHRPGLAPNIAADPPYAVRGTWAGQNVPQLLAGAWIRQ
jgi:hypothetical protein